MDAKEQAESERPAAGIVSSPRGYFGRASRAAAGPGRAVPAGASPAGAAPRTAVYRAGDPALRVFAQVDLPYPPATPLTGAVATLSGIADGERERLLIELGTTLVRATPRRDAAAGTFSISLSRTQGADVYRALLATVRYVNEAAAPRPGARRVVLHAIDAAGASVEVAAATIAVGEPAAEAAPEAPAAAAANPPAFAAAPVLDRRVVVGEAMRFNTDGDFTLFWWPRLLAAGRARRARPGEAAPDTVAVTPASSFFSQGGRAYRVFDPESETAPGSQRRAANDGAPAMGPVAAGPPAAAASPANDVWMPGRGLPPPGFEPPPPLRLEDVFGSDMENALLRRILEQRVAARA